jgi:hypothetical protein
LCSVRRQRRRRRARPHQPSPFLPPPDFPLPRWLNLSPMRVAARLSPYASDPHAQPGQRLVHHKSRVCLPNCSLLHASVNVLTSSPLVSCPSMRIPQTSPDGMEAAVKGNGGRGSWGMEHEGGSFRHGARRHRHGRAANWRSGRGGGSGQAASFRGNFCRSSGCSLGLNN